MTQNARIIFIKDGTGVNCRPIMHSTIKILLEICNTVENKCKTILETAEDSNIQASPSK